jgi:hypothetical protein
MIVQIIHVHWVLYVLIPKTDSAVFVHRGTMIALMVREIVFIELKISRNKKKLFFFL